MLKSYLKPFRWHQDLWKPFLIDAITLPIIVLIWLSLGKILTRIAYSLSQGRSLEELKLFILSSPEAAQAFVANTKYLLAALIGGPLLAFILTILIFSLSRAIIWQPKFDRKRFWKWNGLNLTLLLILVPYIMLNLAFNLLLNFLTESEIARGIANGFFLIVFLVLLFTIYHSFARTYNIAESINYALKAIKRKFREYAKAFLSAFIVGLILSLIVSFLKKQFYWTYLGWPKWLTVIVELGIFLAYIAWIRFYLSRI